MATLPDVVASQSAFRLLELPLELQLNVLSKVYEGVFVLKAHSTGAGGISWLGSPPLAPLLINRHFFQQALPFYRSSSTTLDRSEVANELLLKTWLESNHRQWFLPMVEMLIVSLAVFTRRPSRILDLPLSRLRIVRINHETVLNLFLVKDRTADDVADAWLGEAAPIYKGVIQRDMQTALQDPTTLEQFSGIELQAVWKVIGMPRLSEDKGFILVCYRLLLWFSAPANICF